MDFMNKDYIENATEVTEKELEIPYRMKDVRKAAKKKLFTVFSTFAGGGGSSTGYKLAGGDVRGIIEFQKVGVRGYLKNYPGTKFFCKDIRNVTGEQVLKRLRMEPGELDIFDGSPPCPPFSMSGSKRKGWNKTKTVYGFKQTNIEDLSFDVARLVGVVKPKVFICENVKGMTMEYAHDHFQSIMDAFANHDYEVGWRVFNAKNFGVPQARERVFIVGVRADVWKAVTGKDLTSRVFSTLEGNKKGIIKDDTLCELWPQPLLNIPTLGDTIHDLMDDEENKKEYTEIMSRMKKQKRWEYLKKMPTEVPYNGDGSKWDGYTEFARTYFAERENEWELLTDEQKVLNPKFCWENKKTGERILKRHLPDVHKENRSDWKNISYVKYSGFQVRRVSWDKPSHTLTERGLQVGTSAHLHPKYHRGFTSIEARRIMSLPDDYYLDGDLDKRLARVGLMVAPFQMKYLADSIYKNILKKYKELVNA